MPGIDQLRYAMRLFYGCTESFLHGDTPEWKDSTGAAFHPGPAELLRIARAAYTSEYTHLPDTWTPRMLRYALAELPIDDVMPKEWKE